MASNKTKLPEQKYLLNKSFGKSKYNIQFIE